MESKFNISKLTSFKIGGEVEKVYFPTSLDEFVEICKNEKNAKIFGSLSNTLVSSYGYDGAVILTTKLCGVETDGTKIYAECGIKGPKLAQIACEKGLSGFEFMIGFPGSLGGNICMNASAHGQSISDHIISIKCFDGENIINLSKEDMKFSYRHSICSEKKLIVLGAIFELERADVLSIQAKMNENLNFRKTHQPTLALPNCGSVFKNPEGDSAGRLLDSVGAKEMSFGDVCVWQNHANFIVNKGEGSSLEVLTLMDKMSSAVENLYGIRLLPEIKFLGCKNKKEVELCKKLRIE